MHEVYFMPFSNLESNAVYPELHSYLTEKGKAELYAIPFIAELEQATFHQMMQKSSADSIDYSTVQLNPRRYALVNEYEVNDGRLHLVGELLSLRTLASLGIVESVGDPANPEESVDAYIAKVRAKFFGEQRRVKSNAPEPIISREEPEPKAPKKKEELKSGESGITAKRQPGKARTSRFDRTVRKLTVLLTVDTIYAIQQEEPTLQALTGTADTYEAWIALQLTPTGDLLHFLETNKYVQDEGDYAILTLPASLESMPAEFRSLLKQGYGNLAVQVDLFSPEGSKIEPVGNSQYLEKKEDYHTLAGQQFLPVQMLQTDRTVKLYFLTTPRTIDAVVPVHLPDTLRIDRVAVRLAP